MNYITISSSRHNQTELPLLHLPAEIPNLICAHALDTVILTSMYSKLKTYNIGHALEYTCTQIWCGMGGLSESCTRLRSTMHYGMNDVF